VRKTSNLLDQPNPWLILTKTNVNTTNNNTETETTMQEKYAQTKTVKLKPGLGPFMPSSRDYSTAPMLHKANWTTEYNLSIHVYLRSYTNTASISPCEN